MKFKEKISLRHECFKSTTGGLLEISCAYFPVWTKIKIMRFECLTFNDYSAFFLSHCDTCTVLEWQN